MGYISRALLVLGMLCMLGVTSCCCAGGAEDNSSAALVIPPAGD